MRYIHRIFALTLLFSATTSRAQPIRGTRVTNVASTALRSEENIRGVVEQCRRHGINTVFVVVWNAGKTMYPSDVAERYVGIRQDPVYGGFDPLKSIIEQGHAAGLRVHAWFEYGFAYGYRDSLTPWAKRYPHWVGRNAKGHLLQKNGFYWWN
ncbi:MAG: hypothetical protein EBZ67_13530, partial [Chitinophagia bacterium]|nr:hypothetical protein [Chitinophagia bacterium]